MFLLIQLHDVLLTGCLVAELGRASPVLLELIDRFIMERVDASHSLLLSLQYLQG